MLNFSLRLILSNLNTYPQRMKTNFLLRTLLVMSAAMLGFAHSANAQLQVIPGGTAPYNPATNLVSNVLLGPGVTLVGTPTFAGVSSQVGYFNGANSNIGLGSGIIMSSGPANRAIGPNNTAGGGFLSPDDVGSTATDANLNVLGGGIAEDVCKFEFDFIPLADTLRFRYVFASEEYPNFPCTGVNDVFGFFVSGQRPAALGGGLYNNQNIATLPNTTTPISIDNINGPGSGCGPAGVNPSLYINNPFPQAAVTSVQYDGFTVVLTAQVVVVPCTQYHIKLAIGDVGDAIYDSAIFLEASSFGTGLVATNNVTPQPDGTISEGGAAAQVCFTIPTARNVASTINYTLGGTATPGVDYTVTPAAAVIPAGSTQTCITITPLTDAAQEVTETIRIIVQASPCRRDTVEMDLIDPLVVAPTIPNFSLCNGAPGVVLDASQAVIIPVPKVFTNTTSGTFSCACPAPNPPGPPLVSSLAVSGVQGQFNATNAQMRVCMNITHLNTGDIDMYLIDPCGDVLELSTDNGGSGDNMTNTCFVVGQAAPPITGGTAPFTGNFTPEGPWTTFNGCNFNGTWRLQVGDDSNPTNGTLNSWSITFPPAYGVTYAWSPATGLSCTNCAAPIANPQANTTYTVTVSDVYGTSVTDSAVITYVANYPAPVITCGQPTANSLTFNWAVIGGITGYEVSTDGGTTWTSVGTTTTYNINGLPAGASRTISVRAVGSCPATVGTQTCTVPLGCPIVATASAPPVPCNVAPNNTTTITVTAAGNSSALSYQLGAGTQQPGNTFSGVTAGTYTVTVRESATCSKTATVVIAAPTIVTVTATLVDSVSCFGGADGRATAVALGGNNANYSYAWSNGESGANALALAVGPRTVIAFDQNNCPSAPFTITIPEPTLLVANAVQTTPVTCANLTNGTATASATGGTLNYRYLWDGGATTALATGLSVGTHTVTVTDKNGCTASKTVTITVIPAMIISAVPTAANCFAAADGQGLVTVTAGTGTSPYTYAWDSPSTTNPATNLAAGIHTVTVSDANSCTKTTSITVSQPNVLTAVASSPATGGVSCFGYTDGDATVSVTGGTPTYLYNWGSGNSANSGINTLPAGTHTVTVTDSKGCNLTTTVTIISPAQLTATAATISNLLCYNTSPANGVASATVAGGTAPYTYVWDSGSINNPATNLNASTHVVTVTDSKSCSVTATAEVTRPAQVVVTPTVVSNVSCFGGANGILDATVTGGTAPHTFGWSSGSPSGLVAGLYFVTVTDANLCAATASISISQNTALTATTSIVSTVSCALFGDGSISVNPLGGTAPYTYAWSNGEGGNPAVAVFAGTITVTVTDINNCTFVTTRNMSEPTALSIVMQATGVVSCFGGNDGKARADVTGGTPPYTYAWDIPNAISDPINLTAGTHTVTVTDFRNCSATASVEIIENPLLTVTAVETAPVKCFGGTTGVAMAAGSGGVPPYNYLWTTTLGSTLMPTTCPAGVHTVTITDNIGCTASATVTITQPTALTLSAVPDNPTSCFGAFDGGATATAGGGVAPYNYAFDAQSPSSNPSVTNLGGLPAPHIVVVTDANLCTQSTTVIIAEPAVLAVTIAPAAAITCFGYTDGGATATPTGGNAPYNYNWDNGFDITPSPSGFAAGTHTVVVTDNKGCIASASIFINQPTQLAATALQTAPITCNGLLNGQAIANATGGTPLPNGYSYLWDNGNVSQAPNNLDDGIHTVRVTDGGGCIVVASVDITEPTLLVATATSTPVRCFGGNTGTATVSGTGGTTSPPYTYVWSGVRAQISPAATDLTAGTYTVTLTDGNGCSAIATVDVIQPSAIVLTTTQTNVACYGDLSGSATVTASGGTQTSNYSYLWSGVAQPFATATGMGDGTYTVTVTDGNNCETTTSVTITEPLLLIPNASATPILCNGAQNGLVSASPLGGSPPYAYAWNTPNSDITPGVSDLASGVYNIVITDANGCSKSQEVVVQEPAVLSLSLAVTNVNCANDNTGSISVTVAGGTEPYTTYAWSGAAASQNTPTATLLTAGIYTVTVTDANSCSKTISASISEPSAMTLQLYQTSTKCNLGSDGSATALPGGASGGYTYNWSDVLAQTDSVATNLTAGLYTCTVTDALGCTLVGNVTVQEPTALNIVMSMTPVRCDAENTGTATATVTGGSSGIGGGYNYVWTGAAASQGTPTVTNLPFGTYFVTVVDANGCYASSSVEVTTLTGIVATTTTTPVSCFAKNDGTATVTASGGTGVFVYDWNTSVPTATATADHLIAGTYIVTVTDERNCTATSVATVAQPDLLLLTNTSTTPVKCKGGSDGAATVLPQGGNPNYTYTWSTTDPFNETASLLPVGTYNVVVTDTKGCSTQTNVTITEPASAVSTGFTFTEPRCNGGADATATALPGGGTITATEGYTFLWNNGQTTQTAVNLSAGNHIVVVSDKNGCTASTLVTILQPDVITVIAPSLVPPSCYNGRDGMARALAAGGVPGGGSSGYTYLWGTVPPRAGALIDGLFGGNSYTVTATDANQCTGTGVFTIPNRTPMALTTSSTPAACFGNGSGSATVTATGATPAYTYLWSNNTTQQTANGLSAGVYKVTVTDSKTCSTIASVTVVQGSTLSIRSTSKAVRCFGETNGVATAIPTGGAPTYTYVWSSGGGTTATQSNLPQGTYTVTITDANRCTITTAIPVFQPAQLNAVATPTDLLCYANLTGKIHIDATGGTLPYKYTFNTGLVPSPNPDLVGIRAGTYNVTVRDVNGCTATTQTTINEPQELKVDAGSDGRIEYEKTITLTASSNDLMAVYSWTASPVDANLITPNQQSIIVSPVMDTYYYVTATNPLTGCTASDRVQVTVNATRRVFVATAFSPNGDNANDMMYVQGGPGTTKVRSFQIFNRWGEAVFASKDTAPNVPALGWDGKYKGEVVDPAVFIWTAEIEFIDGQVLLYKGDFSVLK
jgi:large repetitive protein